MTKRLLKIRTESRQITITTSVDLWLTFDRWYKKLGCKTSAEGFRTAMRQVTGFNGESQEEISAKKEDQEELSSDVVSQPASGAG